MFSTFRQRKSASGYDQYVLESTTTQLKRPPHRISRLACVYCRSKKVKCTGEEQGCQRCTNKRITCSYTSAIRPEAGSAPQPLTRLTRSVGATSPSVPHPADEVTTFLNDVDKPIDFENHLGWDSSMFSPHADIDLSQFSIGQDMYSSLNPLPFDTFQAVETVDSSAAPSSAMSETTISDSSTRECLCSKMLEVYEIAEIGLARLQRAERLHASGPDATSSNQPGRDPLEELWWQKEVLKSCEIWLSRDAACIQSQHAMLMVSIFDRLLASVEAIAGSARRRSVGSFLESSVSPGRRSSYVDVEEWPCQRSDSALDDARWNENDEEALHVLKSLLSFRTSRLRGLLERLVAIAASNQWTTQTAMVQDMLERLSRRDSF